jgi:hypothetical protein
MRDFVNASKANEIPMQQKSRLKVMWDPLHSIHVYNYYSFIMRPFKSNPLKYHFRNPFPLTQYCHDLVTATDRLCRPQRPRGLKHETSSPARTLGSWVRIPLTAWMSVCVYSVFVLFCVLIAALWRADPPSKESNGLCIGLRNWKSDQGPTKDCRAIDRVWIGEWIYWPLIHTTHNYK